MSLKIWMLNKNNSNEEEEINLDELTLEELNEHANPKQSIFDDKVFETVEDNLEYMRKKFNFVVPDLQYVSDIDGLVKYCSAKVRLGHVACIVTNNLDHALLFNSIVRICSIVV